MVGCVSNFYFLQLFSNPIRNIDYRITDFW